MSLAGASEIEYAAAQEGDQISGASRALYLVAKALVRVPRHERLCFADRGLYYVYIELSRDSNPAELWSTTIILTGLVLPHREMLPDCLMRCVTESLPVFNLKSISSWAPVRRRSRRAVSPAQGRGEVRSRRVLRLSDSLDELVVSHGAISPVACSWPLVWLVSEVVRSQISACERASRPATTAPL